MPSWPEEAGEGVAAGTRPGPLPEEVARQSSQEGGTRGRKWRPRFFSPLMSIGSVLPEAEGRRQPLIRALPANHPGLTLGGEGPRVNARGHVEDLQHPISLKYQAAWQKSATKFSWVYDTRAILCYLV